MPSSGHDWLPTGPFLVGRTALVTGSAKRLGRTLALALAELGADVAVHYRSSEDEASEVVSQIRTLGRRSEAFQADVCDPEACRGLVERVEKAFGDLHILINNVGDYHERPILEEEIADWHRMLDSNLNSTFYLCHHALPVLRRQDYARIINLGFASVGTARPAARSTAYTIAKTGALILTRSLAEAVQAEPLTVNMVSPGVLEEGVKLPPLRTVPKGRWGREDEIASAVAYLLSPQAAYVTGQHLQVAGGWGL